MVIYAVFCRETTLIAILRCLVVGQILSKIYALFWGKISWPKLRLCKKISGMLLLNMGLKHLPPVLTEDLGSPDFSVASEQAADSLSSVS